MRLLRIGGAALAALVAVALLLLWQGPRLLDWNQYRGAVERIASAGLGRPVHIAGAIRLSLLPQATLRATDVSVADAGDGASATAGALRMRVGLSALLTGRIEPREIVLLDARMRLPWPLAGFTLHAPRSSGLRARVEDGTLLLGSLQIGGISGDLAVGLDGNALAAAGLGTVMGRTWRMTGRLGLPGADGSSTVEMSLDGQGTEIGTGGRLSGQLAADGTVSGRITGRGPDLSLLLPAPGQGWSADGNLVVAGGLIVADDLDVGIGGAPARGAVALRLLPQLRLDAALATSRLDLDAWLPPLLHGGGVALPTGIDLSAEAAPFAGGTLRRLRAGFDITKDGVSLRPSDVVVPGEAALQLWGVLQGGKFSGGARLQAPDFPATLGWLRPLAPPLLGAVPLATMPTATLSATVQASAETVGLGTLTGTVAGVPVSGDLALRLGPRPALAANLRLSGPLLDGWMPPLPDTLAQGAQAPAAWSRWAATCDADLTVDAERPVWRGTVFDDLSLQARAANGTVTLAAAKLAGPGIAASLSGRLDPGGRIGDGAVTIDLADAGRMAATLPPSLRFAAPLLRGPGKLEAALSGGAEALAVTAEAELSDASAQVDGRLDVAHAHWRGSVALRHPGAPRLLTAVGLPAVGAWAGDGSLSLQAGADAAPGHVRLSGLDVSAGALHVSGDLSWSRPGAGVPRLDGALAFDTLPVPLPYLRSTNPFPLRALQAMDATVALRTGHLEWGRTGEGDPASAQVTVHDGTLRLDKVAAHLAGGDLSGTAQIVAADPPLLSLDATLSGAQIDAPVFGTGLDLVRGGVDGAVHLRAAGYSPAAVLSSLAGSVQATVHDGVISGLDAGRFMARLGGPAPGDDAAIRQAGAELSRALEGGQTPFSVLQASGGFAAGLLTLQSASLETQGAGLAGSGLVDLPADSLDLSLQLRPAIAGAPAARLRVIGPAATPAHSADLGAILQWLATRPPAPDTASK